MICSIQELREKVWWILQHYPIHSINNVTEPWLRQVMGRLLRSSKMKGCCDTSDAISVSESGPTLGVGPSVNTHLSQQLTHIYWYFTCLPYVAYQHYAWLILALSTKNAVCLSLTFNPLSPSSFLTPSFSPPPSPLAPSFPPGFFHYGKTCMVIKWEMFLLIEWCILSHLTLDFLSFIIQPLCCTHYPPNYAG